MKHSVVLQPIVSCIYLNLAFQAGFLRSKVFLVFLFLLLLQPVSHQPPSLQLLLHKKRSRMW